MQRTASAALVALALLVPHGRAQETPPVVPPPAALRDLEARGFACHPVDLSEYLKAGGAAKCLVLTLPSARSGGDCH